MHSTAANLKEGDSARLASLESSGQLPIRYTAIIFELLPLSRMHVMIGDCVAKNLA